MAKDFAETSRAEFEAGVMAPASSPKEELVNKFVKAWENQTTRRAIKGGAGTTMALTLAACGSNSDDAQTGGGDDTTVVANLFEMINNGITDVTGADPVVSIPNPTAGADALTTTIDGDGTGTLELKFDDAEDTVALAAASDLSGYDTLAITAGTVDVSAVDLGDISSIAVSSGVVLTAAQFLALEDGVTGGSATSTVEIVVATSVEADDVIAAIGKLGGTLRADDVSFSKAEGSDLTDGNLVTLNSSLDAAIAADAASSDLPDALAALEQAEADQTAFVKTAVANEDVKAELAEPAKATYTDVGGAIDTAIDKLVVAIDSVDGTKNPVNFAAAHELGTDAADLAIDATRKVLTDAQKTAADAVTAAATDLDDEDLADLADDVIAFVVAKFAAGEAVNDAVAAWQKAADALTAELDQATLGEFPNTIENGAITISLIDGTPILQLDEDGNVVKTAAVSTSEDGTSYILTNSSDAEYQIPKPEADALIAASQVVVDAQVSFEAAEEKLTDAQDALVAEADVADYNALPAEVTDYLDAKEKLAAADEAVIDFDEDVAAYEALVGLADQVDTLDDAVTAAKDAIQNDTDAADPGLGIKLVAADGFAAGDDLYIFDADDANAGVVTIADFGVDGTDRLYFGEGFTAVDVADDVTFDDTEVGSATVLEIFFQEDEVTGDAVLLIESAAFGGSSENGVEDLIRVELAGVDVADLSFDADTGILTVDNAAFV